MRVWGKWEITLWLAILPGFADLQGHNMPITFSCYFNCFSTGREPGFVKINVHCSFNFLCALCQQWQCFVFFNLKAPFLLMLPMRILHYAKILWSSKHRLSQLLIWSNLVTDWKLWFHNIPKYVPWYIMEPWFYYKILWYKIMQFWGVYHETMIYIRVSQNTPANLAVWKRTNTSR